jgi:pyruvate dehydrogenase E1 component
MPPRPDHVDQSQIVSGIYQWNSGADDLPHRATVLFSGSAQGAARAAQEELASRWGVSVDLYSVTSYKRLRAEALEAERWNRLHPSGDRRVPHVTRVLAEAPGPIVAVTDYMKLVPDQVARWVPGHFMPLGTDGFGRSDTREALRRFFEVDTAHVVIAVLASLAETGAVDPSVVEQAIAHYGIDADAVDPANADTRPRDEVDHAEQTGRRIEDHVNGE